MFWIGPDGASRSLGEEGWRFSVTAASAQITLRSIFSSVFQLLPECELCPDPHPEDLFEFSDAHRDGIEFLLKSCHQESAAGAIFIKERFAIFV